MKNSQSSFLSKFFSDPKKVAIAAFTFAVVGAGILSLYKIFEKKDSDESGLSRIDCHNIFVKVGGDMKTEDAAKSGNNRP